MVLALNINYLPSNLSFFESQLRTLNEKPTVLAVTGLKHTVSRLIN